MKIYVKVKPNSREEKIEGLNKNQFLVRVKPPANARKANAAVIKLLSGYFDAPKSLIVIVSGHKGRNKVIDIKK